MLHFIKKIANKTLGSILGCLGGLLLSPLVLAKQAYVSLQQYIKSKDYQEDFTPDMRLIMEIPSAILTVAVFGIFYLVYTPFKTSFQVCSAGMTQGISGAWRAFAELFVTEFPVYDHHRYIENIIDEYKTNIEKGVGHDNVLCLIKQRVQQEIGTHFSFKKIEEKLFLCTINKLFLQSAVKIATTTKIIQQLCQQKGIPDQAEMISHCVFSSAPAISQETNHKIIHETIHPNKNESVYHRFMRFSMFDKQKFKQRDCRIYDLRDAFKII